MNPKIMKSFVLGAITAYGFAALVLVSSAKLGVLPVQADVAPSRLEASLLGSALHASVARHAPSGGYPMRQSNVIYRQRNVLDRQARNPKARVSPATRFGRWFLQKGVAE